MGEERDPLNTQPAGSVLEFDAFPSFSGRSSRSDLVVKHVSGQLLGQVFGVQQKEVAMLVDLELLHLYL